MGIEDASRNKEMIETRIQECTDKKILKVLNKAWWREWFNEKEKQSQKTETQS